MKPIEITPALLSTIKEKAEKAMPGPWEVDETPTDIGTFYEIYSTDWLVADCEKDGASATFIAVANPAVVLALIAEIERLEKQVELWQHDYNVLTEHLTGLEKEADWLANYIGEHACVNGEPETTICPSRESCRNHWREATRKAIRE